MVNFEWNPDHTPPAKLILHGIQILFSFVAWCLEIAVFRGKDAKITGDNGWTFGVFFLSIPAWVYLVLTPRFARTRKFASAPVMLAVDGVFTLIWLSAFATQAAYNSAGDCGQVCGISKGIVGLGVFNTLLFAATTLVSAYTMTYANFHGHLPGYASQNMRTGGGPDNIDPDKAAFSMAPHDEDAYERVNVDDHETMYDGNNVVGSNRYDGGESSYNNQPNPFMSNEDDENDHYGAIPPRHHNFDEHTEYGSGIGNAGSSMGYGNQQGTYNDNEQHQGPAQFPSGDYDRIQR